MRSVVSQICSVLRAASEEDASEMLPLSKVTWKILKWRILLLLRSEACTLCFIQPVSNGARVVFFIFFFCGSTFPLLHMNRFDGTLTSFIQPVLVFLRISR